MQIEPEILLTKEEIEHISKAGKNPILRHPNVINFGHLPTSICKVTTRNGLIFINGNMHTGLEHINARHSFNSSKYFWKEEPSLKSKNKFYLDNPSKFNNNCIPIMDYATIADEIFKFENLDIKSNKRPEVFDIYNGDYIHTNGQKSNYRLVLYKKTLIVHSLFPTEKIFNRKKIINYAKGSLTAEIIHDLCLEIKIPYHDNQNRIVFIILVRKYFNEKIEECFIEAYNEKGLNIFTHRIGERPYDILDINFIDKELGKWQFGDLTQEEKIIKQLDKKIEEISEISSKQKEANKK